LQVKFFIYLHAIVLNGYWFVGEKKFLLIDIFKIVIDIVYFQNANRTLEKAISFKNVGLWVIFTIGYLSQMK